MNVGEKNLNLKKCKFWVKGPENKKKHHFYTSAILLLNYKPVELKGWLNPFQKLLVVLVYMFSFFILG